MGLLEAILAVSFIVGGAADSEPQSHSFASFDPSAEGSLIFRRNATISQGALQVTPDTTNPNLAYSLTNQTGRVLLNRSFRLWKKQSEGVPVVASFNTSFVLNILPLNLSGGEGLAFIIAPDDREQPANSHGRFLGLFNASTDGNSNNRLLGVEFDTRRNGDDPDDNHVGIDLNTVNSKIARSLTPSNIYLKSASDIMAWIAYDNGRMEVYVANRSAGPRRPSKPIISYPIDLSEFLSDTAYFGFAGSTGDATELNCVLSWDLSILEPPTSRGTKALIVGLCVGLPAALVALGIVALIVFYRKPRPDREITGELKNALPEGPREFKYKHLKKATDNFDRRFELGRRGFGVVYRGFLRGENSWVAVKRIAKELKQGKEEFLAEIKIISRLRHRNLVRLLGWCHERGELLLVYEYMAHGSVDRHIFRKEPLDDGGCATLAWERRYNILVGVASALTYLHQECEQQVIHRDLKASNIMLDSQYNARLGDFGFARLIERDRTSYTATGVAGTLGYIAPECIHTGKATAESDVYSFGAVALEVACGRRPRWEGGADLVDWVWKLYREGKLMEAADARLGGEFEEEEMRCVLMVGLACSRSNAADRPTMMNITRILGKTSPAPWVPPFRPPFFWPNAPSTAASSVSLTSDSQYESLSTNSLLNEGQAKRGPVQGEHERRRRLTEFDM